MKTFHRVFRAIDSDHIVSRLLYEQKIFCTMLFSIDVHWNAPPWNWRNCLLDVKMFLEDGFTSTYRPNDFFVTFWKLIRSHAVTPRWLDDAKECIQLGWSKQRDSWSLAHEMLVASKAVFPKNYLTLSTWILNRSAIECLEKKYQPFSFAGVGFASPETLKLEENFYIVFWLLLRFSCYWPTMNSLIPSKKRSFTLRLFAYFKG